MEHVTLWLKFAVASGLVVAAGLQLTRNAERLAGVLGWGHAFAGFVILGWATSLPEVTISVSAITDVGSADLSAGNITGSVIFNLAILAVLELLAVRRRTAREARTNGVIPLGLFNVVMLAGLILLTWQGPALMGTAGSRATGIFLIALYLAATLHAWRSDRCAVTEDGVMPRSTCLPIVMRCALAGIVILGAGLWLARLGDEIAVRFHLSQGLVGTLFLASVSSLPELVTGLAAMRAGLLTLAAGSILGSNIFNMGILGACDLLYQTGDRAGIPLVVDADPTRMLRNAGAGLVLTILALLMVRVRMSHTAPRWVAAIAAAMLVTYTAAIAGS